jgi:hypothetical protein
MISENNTFGDSLNISSLQLKSAFDRHLYISSNSVLSLSTLCYDGVLCYLSNIIGQGSLIEIEQNLQRFFSSEQIHQAYKNLHHCLDYCLTILDSNQDQFVYNILQQCSIDLIDSSSLLIIMEILSINKLFSYLPTFVTNDWLHMIRSIQNLEKFDIRSSSMSNLQEQMFHLKERMGSLDHLIRNFNNISSTIQSPLSSSFGDQCCLRTYCTHSTAISTLTESPSSSWSSLDIDTKPVTSLSGFIRNPVTNFIMPTGPTETEMESSIVSLDGTMSSDDESQVPSKILTRSLSAQPQRKRTGPILVKRADVLWMYPAGVLKAKYNSPISSVYENDDQEEFEPVFKRTNSCDIDFPVEKLQDSLSNKILKKPKKTSRRQTKGLNGA